MLGDARIWVVRLTILTAVSLVLFGAAFGQGTGQKLAFEEASVRPASKRAPQMSEIHGGPGTAEPSQFTAPAQFLPNGAEFLDTVRQPAPDAVTAADDQLGLTLKKGKILLDVLVIDHAEKVPADN